MAVNPYRNVSVYSSTYAELDDFLEMNVFMSLPSEQVAGRHYFKYNVIYEVVRAASISFSPWGKYT